MTDPSSVTTSIKSSLNHEKALALIRNSLKTFETSNAIGSELMSNDDVHISQQKELFQHFMNLGCDENVAARIVSECGANIGMAVDAFKKDDSRIFNSSSPSVNSTGSSQRSRTPIYPIASQIQYQQSPVPPPALPPRTAGSTPGCTQESIRPLPPLPSAVQQHRDVQQVAGGDHHPPQLPPRNSTMKPETAIIQEPSVPNLPPRDIRTPDIVAVFPPAEGCLNTEPPPPYPMTERAQLATAAAWTGPSSGVQPSTGVIMNGHATPPPPSYAQSLVLNQQQQQNQHISSGYGGSVLSSNMAFQLARASPTLSSTSSDYRAISFNNNGGAVRRLQQQSPTAAFLHHQHHNTLSSSSTTMNRSNSSNSLVSQPLSHQMMMGNGCGAGQMLFGNQNVVESSTSVMQSPCRSPSVMSTTSSRASGSLLSGIAATGGGSQTYQPATYFRSSSVNSQPIGAGGGACQSPLPRSTTPQCASPPAAVVMQSVKSQLVTRPMLQTATECLPPTSSSKQHSSNVSPTSRQISPSTAVSPQRVGNTQQQSASCPSSSRTSPNIIQSTSASPLGGVISGQVTPAIPPPSYEFSISQRKIVDPSLLSSCSSSNTRGGGGAFVVVAPNRTAGEEVVDGAINAIGQIRLEATPTPRNVYQQQEQNFPSPPPYPSSAVKRRLDVKVQGDTDSTLTLEEEEYPNMDDYDMKVEIIDDTITIANVNGATSTQSLNQGSIISSSTPTKCARQSDNESFKQHTLTTTTAPVNEMTSADSVMTATSADSKENVSASNPRRHCPGQAYKFYMEQHVENVMKEFEQRRERAKRLEHELVVHSSVLDEQMADQMRQVLRRKESNYLRMKRAKLDKRHFKRLKRIGVGAFGEVSLVRSCVSSVSRGGGSTTTSSGGVGGGSGGLYAMKTLKKSHVVERNQVAHVMAEKDILAEADNDWIVKLYYSFQDVENLYFVMEYIPGGDLMSLLIKLGRFDEDMARFYIAELTCAVESVHAMGFIHRDIKPDNILIDAFGHIKLTDFGLCTGFRWTHNSKYYHTNVKDVSGLSHIRQDSMDPGALNLDMGKCSCSIQKTALKPLERRKQRLLQQTQQPLVSGGGGAARHVRHARTCGVAHSLVGTPNYIAPEVLLRQAPAIPQQQTMFCAANAPSSNNGQGVGGYTQTCDWWSVGVILYEMIVGQPPFLADTPAETQIKVVRYQHTLYIPPEARISIESQDLIMRLCSGPEDRLGSVSGSEDIKNHSFFKGKIDFTGHELGSGIPLRKQQPPYIPTILHELDTSNFDPIEEEGEEEEEETVVHGNGDGSAKLAPKGGKFGTKKKNDNEDEMHHGFYEFTFRRFFDDGGHPLRLDHRGGGGGQTVESSDYEDCSPEPNSAKQFTVGSGAVVSCSSPAVPATSISNGSSSNNPNPVFV